MTLCQDCVYYRPDHNINGGSIYNVCGRVEETLDAPDSGEASIENNAYAEADAVLKVSPSFGCIMGSGS